MPLDNHGKNAFPKAKSRTSKEIKKKKYNLKQTIFGFTGGVILSFIIFSSLILQDDYSMSEAAWLSGLVAIVLTFGLVCSQNIQCITLLILPQLFSKRGRTALVTYIWIITLAGPGINITKNTEVLSASLSCGQEQLKTALNDILIILKKPFLAIKNAIKHIIKSSEKVLVKVKEILVHMKELIFNILNVIKNAFKFLANIVSICNKKIGTPFQRCVNMFAHAIEDCREQLGFFHYLCNVAYLAEAICYSVKFLDYVCMLLDFVSDSIVNVVKESKISNLTSTGKENRLKVFQLSSFLELDYFNKEIQNMFYVSVKFHHSFHFHTNTSKTFTEIKNEIFKEVENRSKGFFLILSWMRIISAVFFIWMIFKIIHYKSKFLSSPHYDNSYLNRYFYEIDERRYKMGKESALPLVHKEHKKYVELTSFRLIRSERIKIIRSASFLTISSIQILSITLMDYSLSWILATIQFYGRNQSKIEQPPVLTLGVTGDGFLAELYEGIVDVFRPISKQYSIDPTPCLPHPYLPNYNRYLEIAFSLFLSWFFVLFEPYGLRLRQIVMNRYYPNVARERASWLYNQILNQRGSFIKYARREARRKFLKDKTIESISCLDRLRAKYNHIWIIRKILGSGNQKSCMLCGTPFKKPSDQRNCINYKCPGIYCVACFNDLNGTCSICMNPVEYGDLSDISEEMDSSDDPVFGKYVDAKVFDSKIIAIQNGANERKFYFEVVSENESISSSLKKNKN